LHCFDRAKNQPAAFLTARKCHSPSLSADPAERFTFAKDIKCAHPSEYDEDKAPADIGCRYASSFSNAARIL